MELTTTFNRIKKHNPCARGWEKALRYLGKTSADDEPLPLLTVLESNGFDDAVWGLRALDDKYDNAVRLFVCFCARYSLDIFEKEYPGDNRPRLAIEVAERYAKGLVTKEELAAAWDAAEAARATVLAAAVDAIRTAARDAAVDAIRTVARDAVWAATCAAWIVPSVATKNACATTQFGFADEFKRLCLLEGEYGEVVRKDI